MSVYTKYTTDVKEQLVRIRNPGNANDGLCNQRVIFSNPNNIYNGQFTGKIVIDGGTFENVTLCGDSAFAQGQISSSVMVNDNGTYVSLHDILSASSNLARDLSTVSSDLYAVSSDLCTVSVDLCTVSSDLNMVSTDLCAVSVDLYTISSDLCTVSSDLCAVSSDLCNLSFDLCMISVNLNTVSSDLCTISANLNVVSTDLCTVSVDLNTVSSDLCTVSSDLCTVSVNLGELSTCVDKKIFIDQLSVESLSIAHISQDDFYNLIATSSFISNMVYAVSGDYVNAFDRQVKYLAPGTDLSDAVNLEQLKDVDARCSMSVESMSSAFHDELENYLPLSGGTMSGDITLGKDNQIVFGSNEDGTIVFQDPLEADFGIHLSAEKDGQTVYQSKYIFSDTYSGFNVVEPIEEDTGIIRSGDLYAALSFKADADAYLPLSGGALSGSLSLLNSASLNIGAAVVSSNAAAGLCVSYDGSIWKFGGQQNDADVMRRSDVDSALSDACMSAVTWLQLKTARDISALTPGMQYRITDYCASTNGNMSSTAVAEAQFDIIVVADGSFTLNENARAARHAGDTYFNEDTKFEAWKLQYCLDNDSSRFAWADPEGKGVVYRMVDEFRNDVPYDFRGLMFIPYSEDGSMTEYRFTFDDGSGNDIHNNSDSSIRASVYGNAIMPYASSMKQELNEIVFLGSNCYSNIFGDNCYSNTFGEYCSSNMFGEYCSSNTFGDYCSSNMFGDYCSSNMFGGYCSSNTFDDYCSSNTFGQSCSSNTFDQSCSSNTFDQNCSSNTFGQNCYFNTFGQNCYSNTFDQNCYSNTFGDYCSSNMFGDYCSSNSFGASSSEPLSYYRYINVHSGNMNITLHCTETTSDSQMYQNVTICKGFNIDTALQKIIADSNVNQQYETVYQSPGKQVISQ